MTQQTTTARPPGRATPWPALRACGALGLGLLALVLGLLSSGAIAVTPAQPYAPILSGRVVSLRSRGVFANGDRLSTLIVDARLRDTLPAAQALPPARLVFWADLERFQARTTPLLPDLLNRYLPAAPLAGVMQGRAALLNLAGTTVYQGTLLGQLLSDHSLHLVLEVSRTAPHVTAPPLTLSGVLTLRGGLVQGRFEPGAAPLRSLLAVPRGPVVPWPAMARQLSVPRPAMVGRPLAPAAPAARGSASLPAAIPWYGPAAVVVLLVIIGVVWWRPRAIAAEP